MNMPHFHEHDGAIRREPRPPYAWDGVAEVRPFGAMEKNIVEGGAWRAERLRSSGILACGCGKHPCSPFPLPPRTPGTDAR